MRTKFLLVAALVGLTFGTRVSALPTLQLDIVGGVFDPVTETTLSDGAIFDLRALYKGTLNPTGTYYVSAAVVPNPGMANPPPAFGSVLINGTNYSSGAFLYGKPPSDVLDTNSGNLAGHGIYPTYYLEFAFNFDALHTVGAYNVQDGSSANGSLYYHDFNIDVTGLLAGYELHFDLYDETVKKGLPVIDNFAPFSHDAQSKVPDSGTTWMLVGAAVIAMGVASRLMNSGSSLRAMRLRK